MLYGEPVASVADELLIQSLPDEVRQAIVRVYGPAVATSPGTYTKEDLREAFEAGFEEAAEQFERPYRAKRPWLGSSDFDYWLKSR